MKYNPFDIMYTCIRNEKKGIGVIYDRKGNYSVMLRMENPVEQYCADTQQYYNACHLYKSIIDTMGEGYSIQKQDVFCKKRFKPQLTGKEKFLGKAYMDYFSGREYVSQQTYLIITQEVKRSAFEMFDKKKWNEFWQKVSKVQDTLSNEKVVFSFMDEREIVDYLRRYLALAFDEGAYSYDNFRPREDMVKVGERLMRMVDVVDIDEVLLPDEVRPYGMMKELPTDMLSFLSSVPGTESVIYTQTFIIPSQRKENAKLTSTASKKRSLPDPANRLAADDIDSVLQDIARNNDLLAYVNFSVMVTVKGDEQKMMRAYNYLEKSFYDRGVQISRNSYNQIELYVCSFPGNQYALKDYEKFLTLVDSAVCFMYKERIKTSEKTPLKVYYTDRQGVPVAIDITGKEGDIKYTTNSNFFSLGPSGSGKSFHMNSVVRQLHEQDTDIVLVDTGNSYEGLCAYFGGTYITYTKEKPITMNPFFITEEENNIEKQNFLKSLILLLWKGADGNVSKTEDGIIEDAIKAYYDFYFNGFKGFTEETKKDMEELLMLEQMEEETEHVGAVEVEKLEYKDKIKDKIHKLEARVEDSATTEGEKEAAKNQIQRILHENGIARSELESPQETRYKIVKYKIDKFEEKMMSIQVKELSFNSFYEFSIRYIPMLTGKEGVDFDLKNYKYLLSKFYKGGKYETTLNNNMGGSLMQDSFIVFEIDEIKDDPTLFPIVTLIIMDTFIQKMRLKKNRKALIIEEAWKAIASPMMAGYILYLYKTVRKFWGIVGVVTQELNDIISNKTVKDSILNNSEVVMLLDQSKFRERYDEIAQLLGLTDVERQKIWTINSLDNREGRSFFKEVYIRRGNHGDVLGVEESPQSYMAYTTERVEKDALKEYVERYGSYEEGIVRFCRDWKKSCGEASKADKYAVQVNNAMKIYTTKYESEKEGRRCFFQDWKAFDEKGAKGIFPVNVVAEGRPVR
nr:hypothetical protein [Clostridia bacterium]